MSVTNDQFVNVRCVSCGRPAVAPHYCAKCQQPFCGPDAGGKGPACGYRRDNTSEVDDIIRLDYRCRRCAGALWRALGTDWAELGPLARGVIAFLLACVAFWIALIAGLSAIAPLASAFLP